AKVQTVLERDPFSGHVFVFRGKRGDLVKVLWWSGDGMCLLMNYLASYYESPRIWWRLQLLREWSYEQVEQVFC
ncbi:IS66 family insertion sequence element accessory protein TnpB, partial [Paraburkholderia sp. NMBU_R16]|uniref:IS66 family insertion sequence element accessory protein TnpB n=1 Tax=Paraburkholderia sp. NMBU_R16 TaxID=2698676 RepID=UPI0015653D61|nr:IS66 family insertion sequence element accessory protein TnpB [Paraburkholderia sp. NMBU_R16]